MITWGAMASKSRHSLRGYPLGDGLKLYNASLDRATVLGGSITWGLVLVLFETTPGMRELFPVLHLGLVACAVLALGLLYKVCSSYNRILADAERARLLTSNPKTTHLRR